MQSDYGLLYALIRTLLIFYKQHFYKQLQAEIGKKNQANAKQHPEIELSQFENYSYSLSTLSSTNNSTYSKK